MAVVNVLADELLRLYPRVEALDFYREIFPLGSLDDADAFTHGKYTALALEIIRAEEKKTKVKRYTVTDDLDTIAELLHSENFCLMSPISYAGKKRNSANARIMYALCVELDNLIVKDNKQDGLLSLIDQWGIGEFIPCPTFVVASGNGIHLYYLFAQPLALFPNVVKSLEKYKRVLTQLIWNRHTTVSYKPQDVQQESIFQGFRMVGTRTKAGDETQAFRTGKPVSIEYMNKFITVHSYGKDCGIEPCYKSELTLAEAQKKYPDWYERRIVNHEAKGHWVCNRAVYDWWKEKISFEAKAGHRYYCLMLLSIYAIKCEVSEEELVEDAYSFLEAFEEKTSKADNHFTEDDVQDAIQAFYDKSLITYPVNSIGNRAGIEIPKNKRNGRKQKDHVLVMNKMKEIKRILGEDFKDGRPQSSGTKQQIIAEWRQANPDGKKIDCERELKMSRHTVLKWWEK